MSDNHGHHEQNLFHKKVEHTEEKTAFPSAITKKIFILETCSDSGYMQLQLWREFLSQNPSDTMCWLCDFGQLKYHFVPCFPAYKNGNNATAMS